MQNIAIMDPDTYVKYGLCAYLKPIGINVTAVSNISDLLIALSINDIDIVVMELCSHEDDVFGCIEFARVFSQKWPNSRLIIYTQISNMEAIKLLIAVTGQKEIIFKNENLLKLTACVLSS